MSLLNHKSSFSKELIELITSKYGSKPIINNLTEDLPPQELHIEYKNCYGFTQSQIVLVDYNVNRTISRIWHEKSG